MLEDYDSSDDEMEYDRDVGLRFEPFGGRHLHQRRLLPAVPGEQNPAARNSNPVEPINISWLCLDAQGFPESVAISELPGANFRDRRRDLRRDIDTILSNGITDVVCLLTQLEFAKFRVPNLLVEYEKAGMIVYHYPMEDGMVPEDVHSLIELMKKIRDRIADGNRVLIHCYGGLGRAVLVGACLTLELDVNVTAEEAINRMRRLRGPRAVQSVKQYNFINEYREMNSEAANYDSREEERCISR